MRNLKRALSLALASVMLLGMMVVGTSAASYPDVDENDNVEAIEVLNAVQVMIGDRGNFRPDAKVNRHEMAVIMAKLVLGNEAADNYVGSHPFTDVFPWADKYVAACYENGLVSGTSATTFSGNQPLTAVQAAAMMLRALGYKDLSKGATDWRAPVTAMANQIRLFSGVASNPKEELDRNQVAQLALNTLKSSVVDMKEGLSITGSNGDYTFTVDGNREYIVRSSLDSYARAISAVEQRGNSASGVGGYTVELGEHLYNGKLTLVEDNVAGYTVTDDFGRPARHWEYDGKEIGTYAKTELLRAEYTTKVTGKMLYELLGSSTVKDFGIDVTIDGNANDPKNFGRADITRTNTDAVGATGNGTLTQVFVDGINKEVDIVIVNTYLAVADGDYSASKDEVTLKVYNLDKSGSLYFKDYKQTGDGDDWKDAETPLKVAGDDFDVKDVKKDDLFLVTVAEGDVKTMVAPEVLSEQTITSHKVDKYVVADKQYDYATTAQYDTEVMESFGSADMKEVTYDIFLDKYGYLIGVEQNEKVDEYVFLTGVDDAYSYLSKKNVPVNIIHMDGTMETVTMNTSDSTKFNFGTPPEKASQANTWCTYSVDKDGIYTLKQVAAATSTTPKIKVAQSAQDAAVGAIKINSKNISLNGSGSITKVHGNDNTVYINAEMENVKVADAGYRRIIKDVDSITTGVTKVDMTVSDIGTVAVGDTEKSVTGTLPDTNKYFVAANEVYTLYKDNGTIIAVVTLEAVDNATTKSYAYINSSNIDHRDYDASTKEYSWYRQAIVDGEFVMLKEVDDDTKSSYVGADVDNGNMAQGAWYEIKYNADGEVRGANAITYAAREDDDNIYDNDDVPTGTNYNVGIHYMRNANHVANALDKTFILNADYHTNANVELKYSAGTLYVGNDATKGVYIDPNAKVVVFTKNYDKHEEFSGKDMEKALSALVDKKSFDGYVNAVIGDDGVADVVILDEKNMAEADKYTISFSGDTTRVTINGNPITGIAEGGSAYFTVTAKSGSVLNSVTVNGVPLTPDANGWYTIPNITANVTVTINATKDGNAYDGEIVFSNFTESGDPYTVDATWNGDAAPSNEEVAAALGAWLKTQNYNVTEIASLADNDVSLKAKKTIAGMTGPEVTIKVDPSAMTRIVEVTNAANLAQAMTDATASGKVVLKDNATVTAAPTCAIEVTSGKTLTINAATAVDLGKDITGAGNVTISGVGGVTTGEKLKVSGDVTISAGSSVDNLASVTGNINVDETITIATGKSVKVASGKTLTIATGKTLTLTDAASTGLDGSIAGAGKLKLTAGGTVNNITAALENLAGALTIKGAATPSALTWTAGNITVNAGASLTLPASTTWGGSSAKLNVNGTVTLGDDIAAADVAAVIAVGANGNLNLNGKTLTAAAKTAATITIAEGGKITGTGTTQNFYANAQTTPMSATQVVGAAGGSTYTYKTITGTTDGWEAGA